MKHRADIYRYHRNESGFILATVILFVLILTVVTISIMSLNVSQTISGQSVVDSIKAEQLAIGAFYQNHQLRIENCPNPPCATAGDCNSCPASSAQNLDQKTFTVNVTNPGVAGGNFNNTQDIRVAVTY